MESADCLPHEDILHLTSLEEVLGGFAHEIAQPLHTIMIASQVLQLKLEHLDLEETEKSFLTQRLNIVAGQVQRATEIMESLRSFVRRPLPDGDGADLEIIFRHIRSLVGQQFLGRGIELICNLDGSSIRPKQESQFVEAAIIQALAHARDTVDFLESWHTKNDCSYKKSVNVTASGAHSFTVRISWNPAPDSNVELPNPKIRPGLMAAASILKSAGGGIEANREGIFIHFPA